MQREEEGVDVVWNRLQEAINWVERMAREWSWNLPFVVDLVKGCVQQRMVKPSMNPIDTTVLPSEWVIR